MLKTISALAFAATAMASPALAQNSKSSGQFVNAPVAPVSNLTSAGLAGSSISGGVIVAGVVVIGVLAGNDSTISTTSTTSTTPGG